MQNQTSLAPEWRPSAIWITVALCFAVVSLASNLLEIRYSYLNPGLGGSWGMTFQRSGGEVIVQSVERGSNAASLGVHAGDHLRPDRPFLFRLIPVAGETLQFERVAPGPTSHFRMRVPRAEQPIMAVPHLFDRILDDAVRLLLLAGGVFILWRGSRRRSGFFLGVALLSMSPFPPFFVPMGAYSSYFANAVVFGVIYLEFGLFLPLFAMVFLADSEIRVPRWAVVVFSLCVAETAIAYILIWIVPPGFVSDIWSTVADRVRIPAALVDFALTVALLMIGSRKAKAESRHRFVVLLLAIGLIYLSNMLYAVFISLSHSNPRLLTNSATAGRTAGAVLFAYAVLRHRVIDVGFTLNRTLVYGGVSGILLVAFGLAEWGLHQVLALEGWEGSAVISATLAVTVFLAFHPLRNVVEHYVSTIFFRPWRNKEQALRKFVRDGGFFTDAASLAASFARALETFTGSSCCVYRLSANQSYVCTTGKGGALHVDDPVAVSLRAQAAVWEIGQEPTGAEGVLAFPMIHAHNLEGFAVLGAKGNGERYRPDEIELVEWATRQIGQDLYRLDVEQLKRERDERDREIAVLTGRNADLQLALANRSRSSKLRRVAPEAIPAG